MIECQEVGRPPSIVNHKSEIDNSEGSFFQRRGYQVVNLATRVRFPHEPLIRPRDGPFV
jgi:hypothetical protein